MAIGRRGLLAGGTALGGLPLLARFGAPAGRAAEAQRFVVTKSDAEWRRLLSPIQFDILRHAGTEPPGSSPLDAEARAGTYACAGCARDLFSSQTKFHSGTGWPSFWAPLAGAVGTSSDTTFFAQRTEVHCGQCGGHLGHVFDDGPKPTGLRYCMNGAVLAFRAA